MTLSPRRPSWRASASRRPASTTASRSACRTTGTFRQSSFDAISSIGMAEHVGESQIDRYARSLFALLRPGGLLLTTRSRGWTRRATRADGFSTRYVFPDGEPLPLSRVQLASNAQASTASTSRPFARTTRSRCATGHAAGRTPGRSRGARRRRSHARLAAVPARGAHGFERRRPPSTRCSRAGPPEVFAGAARRPRWCSQSGAYPGVSAPGRMSRSRGCSSAG